MTTETIDTNKLNLTKGQAVDLEQQAGAVLKSVKLACGWDMNDNSPVDLDISVIVFDENKAKIDQCFFNQLHALGGAIKHSGDNRTGAGDGDDETITVNLESMPSEAKSLVLVLNNYSGQPLRVVKEAFARVLNGENNNELVRYTLKDFGNDTAAVLALLQREGLGWSFKAIGEAGNGTTFDQLIPLATAHL